MNALTMTFRQLVDRKLWPLAILLVVAVAAVPMLLAKDEVDVPAPPVPTGAATTAVAQAPTQPIVTLGDPGAREAVRKVLGARKNPFEPAVKAKAADTATSSTTAAAATSTGGASKGAATGGSGASGDTGTTAAPGVTVVAPTPVKKKTYELWALKIRFGSTESQDLANRSIKRLAALPRMAEPALIYLGMKRDLRTAVFLVDANTMVVGDGRCVPSPTNCQNLELKKGQTAFIDVLRDGASVAQYQLDFVRVLRTRTTDADEARRARRTIAKGGRDALRARVSRINGWVYDPETGVLTGRK